MNGIKEAVLGPAVSSVTHGRVGTAFAVKTDTATLITALNTYRCMYEVSV